MGIYNNTNADHHNVYDNFGRVIPAYTSTAPESSDASDLGLPPKPKKPNEPDIAPQLQMYYRTKPEESKPNEDAPKVPYVGGEPVLSDGTKTGSGFYDQLRESKNNKKGIRYNVFAGSQRVTTPVLPRQSGVSVVNDDGLGTPNLNIPIKGAPDVMDRTLNGKKDLLDIKNAKINPVTIKDPTPPKVDTRPGWIKVRDYLYDEEKIRKESDIRAKTMALGDAARNIFNLAFTIGGATPQDFGGYSPATAERQAYDQGVQARDAKAYQLYQMKMAEDKSKMDAERAAALNQSKIDMNNSTINRNNATTQKTIQDMKIAAEKYPYELQGMIADTQYKIMHASKEEAEASMQKLELEIKNKYGEAEAKAQIDRLKAAATSSYASANSSNASAEKTRQEISQGKKSATAPVWQNGKYSDEYEWDLGSGENNETRKNIASALANYARAKGWVKDTENGASSLEQVYSAVMQNASDPQVQRVLSNYGKLRKRASSSAESKRGSNI